MSSHQAMEAALLMVLDLLPLDNSPQSREESQKQAVAKGINSKQPLIGHEPLAEVLRSAIEVPISKGKRLSQREFDAIAAQIARNNAGDLIQALGAAKKITVRRVISEGLDQGWSDARIKRELALTVGLDPRRAQALQNYRKGLAEQNVPKGKARVMVERFSRQLLTQRVGMIADNEVNLARRTAQKAIWQQQQRDGDISSSGVRVTRNSKLSKPCPICKRQNGKRHSIKHTDGGPPFHPNCKCYEVVYDQGSIRA